MRVMSAIAFVASAYLAVVAVSAQVMEQAGDTELVFYFLAAAFLPKALQKFADGLPQMSLEEAARRLMQPVEIHHIDRPRRKN